MDSEIGTLTNCDILIEGEYIRAVGPSLEDPAEKTATIIDGTDMIVCPGFIDTHRHTWQTQLRTIATDHVLPDYILWLRQIYGSSYTARDAYLGNYCGALESIDNGITYIVDHSHIMNSPEHADAAVRGLLDAKIRAVFCYATYVNPAWEGSCIDKQREEETPDWRMRDAQRIKDQFFHSSLPGDLVRMGFTLSEPDLTPIDQLVHEIEHARALGAKVITAHSSHGKWDPGNFVVRQLGRRNIIGPDLLFSHGTSFSEDELQIIRDYGVGVCSTPDTELQMGMSHPIAFRAKDLGCKASLGVDVCCSTPADMFRQMRLLLQAQRHLEHEATVGGGGAVKMARRCEEVLEMATMGGAKAVGLDDIIGSIKPGKRADLLLVKCDSLRMFPIHDPIGALVLYANGSDIDTVFINGEVLKSGGKLLVDWPKIRRELGASVASIMERAKKAPVEVLMAVRDQFVTALMKDKGATVKS